MNCKVSGFHNVKDFGGAIENNGNNKTNEELQDDTHFSIVPQILSVIDLPPINVDVTKNVI